MPAVAGSHGFPGSKSEGGSSTNSVRPAKRVNAITEIEPSFHIELEATVRINVLPD
jgi:hypothetical protein